MASFGEMIKNAVIPSVYPDVKAMAAGLGLHQSTLHRWTEGKRCPSEKAARKLAAQLGFKGEKLEIYLELWAIAHIPEPYRARFLGLHAETNRLQLLVNSLKARLDASEI